MPRADALSMLALKSRHLRWQRRLTRQQVERRAGLRAGFLKDVEEDRRRPSPAELRRLADVFGRTTRFMTSKERVVFTHHLRRFTLSQDTKRALNRFEQACLDRPRRPLRAPVAAPPRKGLGFAALFAYAERLARRERRRLGPGDVLRLLERQGVAVIVLPCPGIDGAILYRRDLGAFILVNALLSVESRAFVAAHEYSHLLKDRVENIRWDAPGEIHWPKPGRSPMVTTANAFAAAFLYNDRSWKSGPAPALSTARTAARST